MQDRTTPPETFDIEHFMLKKPAILNLDNGIPFFQFYNETLDLIHIHIQIKGGSLYESKKMLSSTYFNLLKESHFSKSASEIDEILDFYGASWNVSTNLEYSSLRIRVFDKTGRLHRNILNYGHSVKNGKIQWDGFDDNGKRLKTGVYILFFEFLDDTNGIVETYKLPVVIAKKF